MKGAQGIAPLLLLLQQLPPLALQYNLPQCTLVPLALAQRTKATDCKDSRIERAKVGQMRSCMQRILLAAFRLSSENDLQVVHSCLHRIKLN